MWAPSLSSSTEVREETRGDKADKKADGSNNEQNGAEYC